jgi:exopolysaccharide biosynthesis polyprenyl glycosylphosphotransferase
MLAIERVVDIGAVATGWVIALMVTDLTGTAQRDHPRSAALVLVALAATVGLFERRSLYERRPRLPRIEETSRTATCILGGATVMALFAAIADFRLGARELLLAVPLVAFLVYVSRAHLRVWQSRDPERERIERIVVIGAGDEARELSELVAEHPDSNLSLVGIVGDRRVAERHGIGHLWLGAPDRVADVMRDHGATSAVVNATGFRGRQFRAITRQVLAAGFDVRISTGITRLYCGRFDVKSLMHEPLIAIEPQWVPRWQLGLKRASDVAGASLALLLAAPVMALAAVAIKLEDGGPVLFRQVRAGIGGTTFDMLKFRSMVPDAERRRAELDTENERSGPLFKITRDPRVTRVGRFIRETSIDELPQLFNVLRGDMSLVGPRPPLPEERAAFDDELLGRFDVRPGITGLWQVEARSNASFNAYRRLDLHYVENWSVWMDVRILLATAEQILVTAATLPVRALLTTGGVDQVTTGPAPAAVDGADEDVLIDLRERRSRLGSQPAPASLESLHSGTGSYD